MRKTLLAVAFAGAALAPAAAVTVAATLAPTSAAVAAPKVKILKAQRGHVVRRPDLRLINRCHMPRLSVRREILRLRHAGFRRVRYTGRQTFLPRCAQFLYFSACKRLFRYRVIVRYIRFQRYVITQYRGRCLNYYRTPRRYRHSS